MGFENFQDPSFKQYNEVPKREKLDMLLKMIAMCKKKEKNQGMNITLTITVILAFIFLFACDRLKNDNILNKNTIFFTEFSGEENIVFRDLFEYKKGNISAIYPSDSVLIFMNSRNGTDYFFYNYSLKKNILSEGFLKKGRGPNEALGVSSAGIFNNSFWIYDITLKKILTINKSKILADSLSPVFNEYFPKEEFRGIDFIDSLSYLTVGDNISTFKIVQKDLTTNTKITEFGQFENISSKKNITAFKDAYTCYIYTKPSGVKFVLPYRYTDVIEIYDVKKNTNIAIQGPLCFNVDYKEAKTNGYFYMLKTKKTRKAFVSGTVTDKFIYLVYSGNLYKDDNWSYGKYIFVYDWEGHPVKKIILDRYVYTIAVSADDKTIYSYDKKNGYVIYSSLN